MAANIGTAYFRVAPNLTGVQGRIASGLKGTGTKFGDQFGKEISGRSGVLIGAIAGVAQVATQKALSLVSTSVNDAISRVDILNNFPKVMSNMGIAFDDASKASDKLEKGLRGLPTTLDTGTLAVQRLTTKTQDVDRATDIFLALNNAVLAGGAPMELQATATEQFAQAFAKGKPDMMEWRSMLSAMPAQLSQVAAHFGMANVDDFGASLREGEISMDDFASALMSLDKEGVAGLPSLQEQAKNATSGIGTSMAVMKTAITRGIADIITTIGSENIAGALSKIGKAFETVLKGVSAGIKFVSDNKDIFAPIAVGIGAIVAAMTVWAAVTKTMAIAQGILNAVMAANPIGLVILAITGLVAGLAYFFTQTETGKAIFQSFGNIVGSVWDAIKTGFNWVKNNWPLLLAILTGPIGVAVLAIIKNWDKIKEFAGKAVNSIKSAFNGAKNFIVNAFSSAVSFISGLPGRIVRALGNMGNLLYNSGKDLINGLINGAGSLLKNIGKFFLDKVPGWIQGPFKKALGISSPSKVFAGYGSDITEGLAGGIDSTKGLVKGAVDDLTSSTLDGMANTSFNPSIFGSSVGLPGSAASGNQTTNSTSIQNVYLGDASAVKEFFNQINQDTINVGMGLTPIQGAQP